MSTKNSNLKSTTITIYRFILCVVGWSFIFVRFLLIITGGGNVIESFSNSVSYYTFQSNLMVVLWLTLALFYKNRDSRPKFLASSVRGAITLYITFTFIIFATVIAPYYHPTGLALYTNYVSHYFLPIAFIIDWLFTEMEFEYEWKYIIYWLIYPLFYSIYTLIRGYFTGFYPYPFFDLNSISILRLIINIIIWVILNLLLGFIYIYVNRKGYKKKNL